MWQVICSGLNFTFGPRAAGIRQNTEWLDAPFILLSEWKKKIKMPVMLFLISHPNGKRSPKALTFECQKTSSPPTTVSSQTVFMTFVGQTVDPPPFHPLTYIFLVPENRCCKHWALVCKGSRSGSGRCVVQMLEVVFFFPQRRCPRIRVHWDIWSGSWPLCHLAGTWGFFLNPIGICFLLMNTIVKWLAQIKPTARVCLGLLIKKFEMQDTHFC